MCWSNFLKVFLEDYFYFILNFKSEQTIKQMACTHVVSITFFFEKKTSQSLDRKNINTHFKPMEIKLIFCYIGTITCCIVIKIKIR